MTSTTFQRLKKRNHRMIAGRRAARVMCAACAAIAMFSAPEVITSIKGSDGNWGDATLHFMGGVMAGAAVLFGGMHFINQRMQPTRVTGEAFDAIEDEEGGFDRELLEVFQRTNGSRPMADYDAFIRNATEVSGSNDFHAACFYLSQEFGHAPGQMLCYDFATVEQLVRVNRLMKREVEPLAEFWPGKEQAFKYVDIEGDKGWLDYVFEKPLQTIGGLCIAASAITVGVTILLFQAGYI